MTARDMRQGREDDLVPRTDVEHGNREVQRSAAVRHADHMLCADQLGHAPLELLRHRTHTEPARLEHRPDARKLVLADGRLGNENPLRCHPDVSIRRGTVVRVLFSRRVIVVMTLRTRDLEAIAGASVSFHLNAGADFVIATDHRSSDNTREVLRAFEREGVLRLIEEDGPEVLGREWRTRMARMAVTEYGADWVFSADGDEFWWPRGSSYPEVLEAVPAGVRDRALPVAAVSGALGAHRPVLRADDGAVCPTGSAERAGQPVPAQLEDRASWQGGCDRRARQSRARDRGADRARRLAPDRDPPLPDPRRGAVPAEVGGVARRARDAGRAASRACGPAGGAGRAGLWSARSASTTRRSRAGSRRDRSSSIPACSTSCRGWSYLSQSVPGRLLFPLNAPRRSRLLCRASSRTLASPPISPRSTKP